MINISGARAEQERLAERVVVGPTLTLPPVVCGVDVSYHKHIDCAVASAVVLDSTDFEVLETASAVGRPDVPYQPGLLSFREMPLALEALGKLATPPKLIIVDGHGYAHPARCGLTSHLGVTIETPTIGCAKTMFIGDHGPLGDETSSELTTQT